MVLGENGENRLTEQDIKAMALVDGLRDILLDGSSLEVFERNLSEACQLDQDLLTNVLGLMTKKNMIKNGAILRAVGAAVKLKPKELMGMIQEIQGEVAVNRSGQ